MSVEFRSPATSEHMIKGVLAFEGDQLSIEYEKDRWFGGTDLVTFEIPVDDIDYAEFRSGLFGAKVKIRALTLQATSKLPWSKSLTVEFAIPRGEREQAMELVEQIEAMIERQEADQAPNEEIKESSPA